MNRYNGVAVFDSFVFAPFSMIFCHWLHYLVRVRTFVGLFENRERILEESRGGHDSLEQNNGKSTRPVHRRYMVSRWYNVIRR